MNFEAQQVKNVSEQARKQRPYGTQKTLLFGLTMISFFIVTYMTITNFTFRYESIYCREKSRSGSFPSHSIPTSSRLTILTITVPYTEHFVFVTSSTPCLCC